MTEGLSSAMCKEMRTITANLLLIQKIDFWLQNIDYKGELTFTLIISPDVWAVSGAGNDGG